jgi:hypothetical protein
MDIRQKLRSYTKDEQPIYQINDFNEMLAEWPNEEDITVYRGINFATREKYTDFLKELKQNGGYISAVCAGFSQSYETAYNFSTTTKTYFPTLEVIMEEAKRNVQGEKIAGYCGVILTALAPKGTVIDVDISGQGVESEVLFAPDQLIKCDVLKVKSFKEMVRSKDFDINQYIENNAGKDDDLLEYLIINKNKKISDENCQLLLDCYLEKFKKTRNGFDTKQIIVDEDNIVIVEHINYRFNEKEKKLKIYVPDTKYFENHEILRTAQREQIEAIANDVIQHVFDIHIKYRDKIDIDYSALKNITPYLDEENKKMYSRMIGYKQKETYDNHNNRFRELYRDKSLSVNQRSKMIDNEMDKLKNFLNGMINNLPESMDDIKKDVKERKEKKRNTLKRN